MQLCQPHSVYYAILTAQSVYRGQKVADNCTFVMERTIEDTCATDIQQGYPHHT